MRTLTEWSRVKTSDHFPVGHRERQNKAEPSRAECTDPGSELIYNLMENIFTSAQLAQFVDGTHVFTKKLHRWQDELQSSLTNFDERFANQTRELLMAVVFPWLRGKVTSKAIDDICFEFGTLARDQKKNEILLSAPAELRPVLERRLGVAVTTSAEGSSEIVAQIGAIKLQTDIETWLEKLRGLLAT